MELRLALGDEAYAEAYRAGTDMTYDEITEFGLEHLGRLAREEM
jgi:hypothetical protein